MGGAPSSAASSGQPALGLAEHALAAERQRHEAELEAERRRSERALWQLLQQKEALQAEKEQMIVAGGAAAAIGTLTGIGALALVRRRHRAAIDALRLAATEAHARSTAEIERMRRFGAEPLGRALVPVCDNIDALYSSLRSAEGISPALVEGANLTADSLSSALSKHGITKLNPETGTKFDPHLHEAIFTMPLSDGAIPGTVHSVSRPGYSLHETRMLRAAQVGVYSSKPPHDGPPGTPEMDPPQEAPPSHLGSLQSDTKANVKYVGAGTSTESGAPPSGANGTRSRAAIDAHPTHEAQTTKVDVGAAGKDVQGALESSRELDFEQKRGMAIEKMLMQSNWSGSANPTRPAAPSLPASRVQPTPEASNPEEQAVGLTGEELHELLVLHARKPEYWNAEALATRFNVDKRLVAATLKHCAAYRVRPDHDESSWMGIAEPILPDSMQKEEQLPFGSMSRVETA